jgi:MoxR-like ATPase
MSCNHCATASTGLAAHTGSPDIEASWAGNREHPQYCPTCHAFLRADGGCSRCEGMGVTSDGETLAMAAPPGATLSAAVASAAAGGETVRLGGHWGVEFLSPKRGGVAGIRLRNGTVVDAGMRFKEEDGDYCVSLGKARGQTTVGRFITPAVDQWGEHDLKEGIVIAPLTDGGVGYYDLDNHAACCGGNCADSHRGMCHHQMAAILAGEMDYRVHDDEFHRQVQEQLRDQFITAGLPPTPEVMRRSDGAYVLLKEKVPEVKVNAGAVGEAARKAAAPPPVAEPPASLTTAGADAGEAGAAVPSKKKTRPKKATPAAPAPVVSPAPRRGNPQVNAVLDKIGVRPPLPTVAERMEDDPTLAGYQGFPVPISDPDYEVGEQEGNHLTQIMRRVNMGWQTAGRRVAAAGGDTSDPDAYPTSMEDRCWGLYGPPGTGKDSMAKEIAASLGLGFTAINARNRSDFQTMLCDTVIEADGKGGTRSVTKLGPLGHALVSGNVVSLSEIIAADDDAQSALHNVMQDGVIRPDGTEGATMSWKVHPNSMIFASWNPGTTRSDKPAPALLSRITSLELDFPTPQDESRRLSKKMTSYLGQEVTPKDVKRCVNLVRGLRELHQRGDLETCPTSRELVSFTKNYYLNGQNRHNAAEVFRVLCSQATGQKDDEWKQVSNLIDSFQEGTWRV